MKFKGMKKYDVILVYDGNSVEYEEEEYMRFAGILINDMREYNVIWWWNIMKIWKEVEGIWLTERIPSMHTTILSVLLLKLV